MAEPWRPYATIRTGKTPGKWSQWVAAEAVRPMQDVGPGVYANKRLHDRLVDPTVLFERQVAHLFRTRLGMHDVQRGFYKDQGGDVDAYGPFSKVVIECKSGINCTFASMCETYASWKAREEAGALAGPEGIRTWTKCFVVQNDVAGLRDENEGGEGQEHFSYLKSRLMHSYFAIFQVSNGELAAYRGNSNAQALFGENGFNERNLSSLQWVKATWANPAAGMAGAAPAVGGAGAQLQAPAAAIAGVHAHDDGADEVDEDGEEADEDDDQMDQVVVGAAANALRAAPPAQAPPPPWAAIELVSRVSCGYSEDERRHIKYLYQQNNTLTMTEIAKTVVPDDQLRKESAYRRVAEVLEKECVRIPVRQPTRQRPRLAGV